MIYSHPSLPGTESEMRLQVEISFMNVKFPYKRQLYSVFIASPVPAVSQNNEFKIILMPTRRILGWQILLNLTNLVQSV